MMRAKRRRLLLGATFCVLQLAGAAASADDTAARIPPSLEPKLQSLTPAQRAFLEGPGPLRLVPTREKLFEELERRTPDDARQYVADMMATVASFAYRPGDDMGAIPLNPEAPQFNSFKVLKPEALADFERAPGPFSLKRYVHEKGGIPTFAGAPVALTPADLVAGAVDVAIAGIPQNMSSGNRDARNGPNALRAMHGIADRDIYSMVDPGAVLNIVDYGDIAVDRMSLERGVDHVYDMVLDIAATGAVPFLVGGDHSLMYPTVKAVRDVRPDEPLGVVHFGAHYDAERYGAYMISDRHAVYRLLEEDVVEGSSLIQIGLRGPQPTLETFEWMRSQGIRYHTMAEVAYRGWDAVMERVLAEAKAGPDRVYVSFDVSVIDPSELAAAGRAAPGGLSLREVIPLVRRLCAEIEIAGFEIMDLAPMLDRGYTSAMNANYVMNACLSGIAMRKQGLTEENYMHPLVIDHGQETP